MRSGCLLQWKPSPLQGSTFPNCHHRSWVDQRQNLVMIWRTFPCHHLQHPANYVACPYFTVRCWLDKYLFDFKLLYKISNICVLSTLIQVNELFFNWSTLSRRLPDYLHDINKCWERIYIVLTTSSLCLITVFSGQWLFLSNNLTYRKYGSKKC